MRTTLSPALRNMLIFSTELVFGPGARVSEAGSCFVSCKHTDCANDGGSTIIALGLELGVEA